MAIQFDSTLTEAPGMTATGIPVPDHVVAALGGAKNAAVAVRVRKRGASDDWYEYRISLATRGGYIMSFSSANRTASGLNAGDPLEVSIELDTAPRTVDVPDDLRAALVEAGSLDALLALSFSKQRVFVESVTSAKAPETRARRIDKVLADLGA
jgi:Bacteriocin-protection, YdeI or OmpD-Associated/Domain of unknown function (DUF1905)